MRSSTRHNAALSLSALIAGVVALCVLAGTALAVSPLPRSDYTVRAACGAPSPGRASCLALQLVPRSAEAQAHTHPLAAAAPIGGPASAASEGAFGLTPGGLHTAYQLPDETTGEQTIALVDAYNDPTAESDLRSYDRQLGLPPCTSANGCFKKVNQRGETTNLPFPRTTAELEASEGARAEEAEGWGGEISLDIETAHATCQNCKILLVEASSPEYEDLEKAEHAAVQLGATEISNSWGGPELGETPAIESASQFNHPGIVITASAGDDGYLEWAAQAPSREPSFPASSPHVVAVGGTRLTTTGTGAWQSEKVWNDGGESNGKKEGYGAGGGGCSEVFEAQPWQRGVADWSEVGCGLKRAVSDVAADADPYSGLAVYYTSRECESEHEGQIVHWCTYGGTSLASPIVASIYALAGGAHGVSYPAETLYENTTAHPTSLHDVVSGSNGECRKPVNAETGASGCTPAEEAATSCFSKADCLARSGFDGPSGVGTPHGIVAFELPATEGGPSEAEILKKEEAERQEEAQRREKGKSEEEAERREEAERQEQLEREERKRLEEASERSSGSKSGSSNGLVAQPSSPSPAPAAPAAAPASGPATPQISSLALTVRALFALNTTRPRATQVAFAFTLNIATHVRISLAKRVRAHGHTRWQLTRYSLTISAGSGRIGRHLTGRGALSPGFYRLTATPTHGAARSIYFQIG